MSTKAQSAQIRIRCGIGDFITYLTRLQSFREQHTTDHLHLFLAGGWEGIPDLICQLAEPVIRSGLINSIGLRSLDCDRLEDWEPDQAPLRYGMRLPYLLPTFEEDEIGGLPDNEKICCIHPITASGSFEGYNEKRYLDRNKWADVISDLRGRGYLIVNIGGKADAGYLPDRLLDHDLAGRLTIRQAASVLKRSSFFVGTNSWPGEVTSYAGIRTVYMYYTNLHWRRIHFPGEAAPTYGIGNLRIAVTRGLDEVLKDIGELHAPLNKQECHPNQHLRGTPS